MVHQVILVFNLLVLVSFLVCEFCLFLFLFYICIVVLFFLDLNQKMSVSVSVSVKLLFLLPLTTTTFILIVATEPETDLPLSSFTTSTHIFPHRCSTRFYNPVLKVDFDGVPVEIQACQDYSGPDGPYCVCNGWTRSV